MSHDPPFSNYDDSKQERLHDDPPAVVDARRMEYIIRTHVAGVYAPDQLASTRDKLEASLALLRKSADEIRRLSDIVADHHQRTKGQ